MSISVVSQCAFSVWVCLILDYFLGLLEELGLPQPGDLACLRDLVKATPEEVKNSSSDRSPRIVAGVINLRML